MNDEHQNSEANRGELSTRTMAMPPDTNPSGDILGGWLLAQMDIAGSIFAHHVAGGRVVTIAPEAMSFHLPVYVGDVVSCYCSLAKQGNSSVSVKVETWVRRRDMSSEVKVTEGCFTFVAVDEQGKPRKISN